MVCPLMKYNKECEDCSEINDKPYHEAVQICDKRVNDFYEQKQADAEYLAELQRDEERAIAIAEFEAKASEEDHDRKMGGDFL